MIKSLLRLPLVALVALPGVARAGLQLTHVGGIDLDASEIVSFDPAGEKLLSTNGSGVDVIDVPSPQGLSVSSYYEFGTVFGADDSTFMAVSSVAADPQGRGFAAAACIPADNTGTPGKVVIFDIADYSNRVALDVGYHPDSVIFSSDGHYLIVTNEGEVSLLSGYEEDEPIVHNPVQAPGSISIIDVSALTQVAGVTSLTNAEVATYDFSPANLADGVSIADLRRNYASGEMYYDIEPEYSTYADGRVYTSLQEANALAVFDIATAKWIAVHSLGTIEQRVDASDRDAGILVDDLVHGMPMPDTVGSYVVEGKTYIVTANEGDAHPADAPVDEMRVKDQGDDQPAIEANYLAQLNALYPDLADGALNDAALGRLNISNIDGLDSNGEITQLTMFGTRSITIWAADGTLVWDSGSFFEDYLAAHDPDAWEEGRSDNKGPEPEALSVFTSGGRTYVAVGMERTQGIFLFDITAPSAPVYQDYIYTATGSGAGEAPEGIVHFTLGDAEYLAVAFEEEGDVQLYELTHAFWTQNDEGWNTDTWYGDVYSFQQGEGWAYQPEQGYQYFTGTGEDAWLYDPQLGWIWTSAEALPLYYIQNLGMWTYYYEGSTAPRWYWVYDGGSLNDAGFQLYPYASDAELAGVQSN